VPAPLPAIDPMPPRATGPLPWVRAGLRLLRDPTGSFAAARARLGDTYVVDAFGYRLFCVFSADGVRALYALPESAASFGLATYNLLKLKLPGELFAGRRNGPRNLFGGDDVERYVGNLEAAMRAELAQLGTRGRFEVFAEMRRVGHRLGLASWIGDEAATPANFARLVPLHPWEVLAKCPLCYQREMFFYHSTDGEEVEYVTLDRGHHWSAPVPRDFDLAAPVG